MINGIHFTLLQLLYIPSEMLPFHQEWNHFWVCPIANQSPYDCRDTHHSTACVFWKETHRESLEYSKTSEQRTHWGKYKFSCCAHCREVVLFSEVQLFGTLKSVLCREVYLLRPYLGESTILEVLLYCKLLNETMGYQKTLQQWAGNKTAHIYKHRHMLWCKGGSRKQSRGLLRVPHH